MTEYYKIAATLSEPEYEDSPAHPKPTHPQVGLRHKNAPNEHEPSIVQRYDKSPPPPYRERVDETVRPAGVSVTLKERFEAYDKTLRRLLPLLLLLAYTLLGGVVFHLVESQARSDHETTMRHRVLLDHPIAVQLERRMSEIVLDRNYSRERRRYEVREALLWYLRQQNTQEVTKWGFVSALFYSMTLYTTIGYGDTAPKTSSGQILTVIYSIIGIPLALVTLIELGTLIAIVVSKLWSFVRHGFSAARKQHRRLMSKVIDWEALPSYNMEKEKRAKQASDDADLLSFPLSALIALTLFWIFFTALLFYVWERTRPWSYMESLYFTFISFTTIGLGDYVPSSTSGKVGGIFFLLVGLSLVSTTLAVLQQQLDAMQNTFKRLIDQEYQAAQSDTGHVMVAGEKAAEENVNRMLSKLSLGNRLLYKMMSEGKKNEVKEYYDQKASMIPKGMQTDDYLWAMTSMSRSYLKKITEEKVDDPSGEKIYLDDTKSRDDVNSLVALCDYTLPYAHRFD